MKRIRRITEELNITDLPRLSYQELKAKYNHILPEGSMPGEGNAVTWGQMWKDEWMTQHAAELDSLPAESPSDDLLQRQLAYRKEREAEISRRETSAGDEEMRLSKIDDEKNDIILSVSDILDLTRKVNKDEKFYNELKDLISKYSNLIPQIKPGSKVIGPEGEKFVEKFSDFRK